MAFKSKLPDLTPASERLKKTITLISGGYSLKPDIVDGRITVYPWDSEISEWVVSSERGKSDFDFTSRVVRKLLRTRESIVDRMVASELMLIMLVARSLASNGKLRYTAVCPHCNTKQAESVVVVPDQLGKIGEKGPDYPGWDEITLPECGDVLRVRPLLVQDLSRASELTEKDKHPISEAGLSNASAIISINSGEPDKPADLITYYLALPPKDVEFIKRHLRETSPALDTAIPHVCDDTKKCGKPFTFNLALHYDFFLSSL